MSPGSWHKEWPQEEGVYWFYVTGGQNPQEGPGPHVVEVTAPGGGQHLYFLASPAYMPEDVEGWFWSEPLTFAGPLPPAPA